jgi:aryl-alcohol dehydrogenase-like predicted oxidoreductase
MFHQASSPKNMTNKPLGSTGLLVSPIGLGCMGMSEFYGPRNDEASVATLYRTLDLGINFLDTADMYGPFHNEMLLGKALKGIRKEVIIATKFGIWRDPANTSQRSINGRPEYVQQACDASLQRLGTDYIDLYYQHRIDPQVPVEETYGAMAALVKAGKVRYLGLSEASAASIRKVNAIHPLTALQSEYSLWSRDVEEDIIPACKELGIGFVAYSPLGRGFLTGTIRHFEDFAADDYRRFSPRFQGANFQRNLDVVQKITSLAAQQGVTPSQMALAWVMAQGENIIPIPGTKRIKYIEENIGALGISFPKEVSEELHALAPNIAGTRYPEEMMKFVNM